MPRGRAVAGRWRLACALAVCCAAAALLAFAADDRGAAHLVLEGGTSGPVPFPHALHQEHLGDCLICHAVFPQRRGAIEALKAQGVLSRKQVMNEQCTRCHRERKQEGKPAGPTACTTCHRKT
ncbi:MAG: cytochrome c3 family protein [Desulfobacterales bacterium]